MNFKKENIMSSEITAAALSPMSSAIEKFNLTQARPLIDKLTLSPASIDKVSATLARNLQPAVQSTPGADVSSLFSVPDDYQSQALELLKPKFDEEGNPIPPSQYDVLRAQMFMQAGQLVFQMISEQMKQNSDNAKTALKAAAE